RQERCDIRRRVRCNGRWLAPDRGSVQIETGSAALLRQTDAPQQEAEATGLDETASRRGLSLEQFEYRLPDNDIAAGHHVLESATERIVMQRFGVIDTQRGVNRCRDVLGHYRTSCGPAGILNVCAIGSRGADRASTDDAAASYYR